MKFDTTTNANDVINSMVQVTFPDGDKEGFRKVKETLQRMGVPSRKDNTLYQTAHVLHKKGEYYICHFKMMFALDGKDAELSDGDLARMNLIVQCLRDWGMVSLVNDKPLTPMGTPRMLKVIKHFERDEWNLKAKYSIGAKKVEHA